MVDDRAPSYLPLTPAMFQVLVALADGEKHGYAIIKEVARRTDGKVRLRAGTLYTVHQAASSTDGLIEETDRAARPGARRRAAALLPPDRPRARRGRRPKRERMAETLAQARRSSGCGASPDGPMHDRLFRAAPAPAARGIPRRLRARDGRPRSAPRPARPRRPALGACGCGSRPLADVAARRAARALGHPRARPALRAARHGRRGRRRPSRRSHARHRHRRQRGHVRGRRRRAAARRCLSRRRRAGDPSRRRTADGRRVEHGLPVVPDLRARARSSGTVGGNRSSTATFAGDGRTPSA